MGPSDVIVSVCGTPEGWNTQSPGPRIRGPSGFERWVSLAGVPTHDLVLPPAPETPDKRRREELIEITQQLGVQLVGAPGELPY